MSQRCKMKQYSVAPWKQRALTVGTPKRMVKSPQTCWCSTPPLNAIQHGSDEEGCTRTHRAGLLLGESCCLQWPPWMRCLWTSSSADGSVQKWSAVFILVYSSAQGPTDTHARTHTHTHTHTHAHTHQGRPQFKLFTVNPLI